jgi:very-short-patch-repair endonuclease
MSLPEVLLWTALRERPGGYKFRKQHAAGPYSLDFYCASAAVCIEVDGKAHDMGSNPQRDERRDAWLASHGVRTLRIPAEEILRDIEPVLIFIAQECAIRTSFKSFPAFAGEGDHPKDGGGASSATKSPSTGFAGPPPPEMNRSPCPRHGCELPGAVRTGSWGRNEEKI